MNKLLKLTNLALYLATPMLANAAPNWLITPEEAIEYQGARGYDEYTDFRPKGPAPTINVVQPDLSKNQAIKPPVSINVVFVPLADAPIDPSTFKAFYGAFRFDITNKLTQKVKVTPSGFSIDQVEIPEGKHLLTLKIEDISHRATEKQIRFEIE